MSRHNRDRRKKNRTKYDTVPLDAVSNPIVLACQPATPAGELKWILDSGDDSGAYSGSVKGTCARCGQEVWIGPRQQEVLATRRAEKKPCEVICLNCAVPLAKDAPMAHLGNPEKDD